MSPLMVGQLLLWCPATACLEQGKATLWLESMVELTDMEKQHELVGLVNAESLALRGARLTLRIRPSARELRTVGG